MPGRRLIPGHVGDNRGRTTHVRRWREAHTAKWEADAAWLGIGHRSMVMMRVLQREYGNNLWLLVCRRRAHDRRPIQVHAEEAQACPWDLFVRLLVFLMLSEQIAPFPAPLIVAFLFLAGILVSAFDRKFNERTDSLLPVDAPGDVGCVGCHHLVQPGSKVRRVSSPVRWHRLR